MTDKEKQAFEKWYNENVPIYTSMIERIAKEAWNAGVEWSDAQERL